MKITKKVTFIAKDDHVAQLKHLLITMVDASRKEVGCLKYDIFQIEKNPKKFIVIESWENEDALEGHKNSEHYKHYKAHYEPFTADKYSDELNILE
jgi:quinol monooxygenase YgiN